MLPYQFKEYLDRNIAVRNSDIHVVGKLGQEKERTKFAMFLTKMMLLAERAEYLGRDHFSESLEEWCVDVCDVTEKELDEIEGFFTEKGILTCWIIAESGLRCYQVNRPFVWQLRDEFEGGAK